MGVSDARANMTEVIAEVRLLGTPVVLTRRDKPQVAVVSVDFYEQALEDRLTAQEIWRLIDDTFGEQNREHLESDLARYRDELRRGT